MAESTCAVSVASVWEVDLKHRLGKLPVSAKRFHDEMQAAGATILPITGDHVLTLVKPAQRHRDLFDRLLLSVAEAEGLVLLTADEELIELRHKDAVLPIRAI